MATAEGVKNKINGLVAAANQKAGRTYTNLTDAVNYLLTGVVINGVVRQYVVHSGANVSVGDFVELVQSWGSGTVAGSTSNALSVAPLSDKHVVITYINPSLRAQAVLLTFDNGAVSVSEPLTISDSASTICISAVALSGLHVLLAYNNASDNEGRVVILRLKGGALEQGTSVQFHQSSVQSLSVAKLSTGQGLLSYTSGTYAHACPGVAQVVSTEGSIISLGPSQVYADLAYCQKAVVLSPTKALAVFCNPEHESDVAGKAIVLTINGNAVQKGTLYNFRNALIREITAVPLSSTRALAAYTFGSKATAEVLTIDGTTVTAGTPVTLEAGASSMPTVVALSDRKAVATWNTSGATKAAVLNINLSTITPGTAATIHTGTLTKVDTVALSAQSALIVHAGSSATGYNALDVAGDTVQAATGAGGTKVKPTTSNASVGGIAGASGAPGATINVYRAGEDEDATETLTDLTGTTWDIGQFTVAAGYGAYNITGRYYYLAYGGDTSGDFATYEGASLRLGWQDYYISGSDDINLIRTTDYICCTRDLSPSKIMANDFDGNDTTYSTQVTIAITGGPDATNPQLIEWLLANATRVI